MTASDDARQAISAAALGPPSAIEAVFAVAMPDGRTIEISEPTIELSPERSLLDRILEAARAEPDDELEPSRPSEALLLDEILRLRAADYVEVWLLYPRGTYSGTGAEVHTAESLAVRLLEKDVLSTGSDCLPVLERWSYYEAEAEDGLSEWSLDDTSDK